MTPIRWVYFDYGIRFIKMLAVFLFIVTFACKCNPESAHNPEKEYSITVTVDSLRYYDKLLGTAKIHDPDEAGHLADWLLILSHQNTNESVQGYLLLLAGIANHSKNPDTAYRCYDMALKTVTHQGVDSLKSRIFYNLAMLHSMALNYAEAMTLLDSARTLAEMQPDFATISNCYNSMGNIEAAMNNREMALNSYRKALQVAEDHRLVRQQGIALGSLATFEEDRQIRLDMQTKALRLLRSNPDAIAETGYLLINIGDDCADPDTAISHYQQAIEIGRRGYIHEMAIAGLNNMAYSFSDKGDFRKALSLLSVEAIPMAKEHRQTGWLSTLYDSYADLLNMTGNSAQAYRYQKLALETATEAEQEHSASQNRVLHALLQSKNKELQIREQSEVITQQEQKVRSLGLAFAAMATAVVVSILLVLLWLQKKKIATRNRDLEWFRKLEAIEEQEQERISMQLHDMIRPLQSTLSELAGSFREINQELFLKISEAVENTAISLRKLSDRLNPVMRSRMTLWQIAEGLKQDFASSSALKISIEVVPRSLSLKPECATQVYFILHELLVNAEKHLGTAVVKISVSYELGQLYILYNDDGKGFDTGDPFTKGLGLSMIIKRAGLLGGKATLESIPGKGVHWITTIPGEGNVILG